MPEPKQETVERQEEVEAQQTIGRFLDPQAAADMSSVLYAKFFRGLGDPTRVRIVRLLLEKPRTVSELVGLLGSPQGRVSSHLGCLRWCGFVEGVREGRNVTYQVSDERVRRLLDTAQALLQENAERVASCFVTAREC